MSATNGGASSLSNGSPTKFSKSTSVLVSDPEKLQSSTAKRRGLSPREGATAIVDPLTMQILRRTGTEGTIRQKARKDSNDRKDTNDGVPDESVPGAPERLSPDTTRHIDTQPQAKEKKFVFPILAKEIKSSGAYKVCRKGVSFLSRIMGGKKKGGDALQDEDGVEVDTRTEGMDAHVFSQPIGYIPQFPAPPKYIRVCSVYWLVPGRCMLISCFIGSFAEQTEARI